MTDKVNHEFCKKCKNLRHDFIESEKTYLVFFVERIIAGTEYYCHLMYSPGDNGPYPMWIEWKSGSIEKHDMPPPPQCPYILEHLIK